MWDGADGKPPLNRCTPPETGDEALPSVLPPHRLICHARRVPETMKLDLHIRKTLGGNRKARGSQHGSSTFELNVELQSSAARIVIVGPSGSGKSLTLQAIAGLLRPIRATSAWMARCCSMPPATSTAPRRHGRWPTCSRTMRCFRT